MKGEESRHWQNLSNTIVMIKKFEGIHNNPPSFSCLPTASCFFFFSGQQD
jgi:hypothetical protein